jgi:hypothetical protein
LSAGQAAFDKAGNDAKGGAIVRAVYRDILKRVVGTGKIVVEKLRIQAGRNPIRLFSIRDACFRC